MNDAREVGSQGNSTVITNMEGTISWSDLVIAQALLLHLALHTVNSSFPVQTEVTTRQPVVTSRQKLLSFPPIPLVFIQHPVHRHNYLLLFLVVILSPSPNTSLHPTTLRNTTSMYFCDECGKQFPSGWNALENHCRDTGHYHQAIVDCYGEDFYDDYDDSDEDIDDYDDDLECDDCDSIFDTEEELTQHEIDEHWYCSECDWYFNSHGSIKSVSSCILQLLPN